MEKFIDYRTGKEINGLLRVTVECYDTGEKVAGDATGFGDDTQSLLSVLDCEMQRQRAILKRKDGGGDEIR